MLPNGINYIFGPSAARGGDASAMLHSDLNNFLIELQHGRFVNMRGDPIYYATHGDLLFTPDTCISRNHRPAPNAELNAYQIAENTSLNFVRISIEHSYGHIQNRSKILINPTEFKHMVGSPHAHELLRVVMLYSNIHVCLNGVQVGNTNYFQCPAPSLEEYLRL